TPLFQTPDSLAVRGAAVEGTVDGRGVSNKVDVSIGFDYLMPWWSFRDFLLAVPAPFVGGFPVLGDTGHVDNHFSFAPHVKFNYYVSDLDLGVGASGTFVNLSGRLQRKETSTNLGTGELDANSSL